MNNNSFQQLSEDERTKKFKAILNTKTKGALSSDDMHSILFAISPCRQYQISVHHDPKIFRSVLQLDDGYRGRTVLGQATTSFKQREGELYCSTRPAAIILRNMADERSVCQLHIFVPPKQ